MSLSRIPHVLVVDDDPDIQGMIDNYLTGHDFSVAVHASRNGVMPAVTRNEVDLVILDLRLGNEDGLNLLREIRAETDVPVIITTGHRKEEVDRVVGLELGADDYITKPFSLRELLARIRVVLRRVAAQDSAKPPEKRESPLRFGRWTLDRRNRRLFAGDTPVMLTKGEYALLTAFVEAPARPLSREHLLQATRVHEDVFDRSIDVQILRLRRKLEDDPSMPTVIRTERGVGYVFTLPVSAA